MINTKVNKNENSTLEAGDFLIRCAICNKSYIGETPRPLKQRIYGHKQALKKRR